jgi:oligosaccharide repeat unit polymerase
MIRPGTSAPGLGPTAVILCGLALTSIVLPDDSAVSIFTVAAVGVGISLSLATAIEATAGIRSLIRVDVLILWVLYGLTFLEFLFPQPNVDALVSPAAAVNGTDAVLIGFAGLVVGRHLVHRRGRSHELSAFSDLRPAHVFLLFVLVTLLGYLHVFLAVNFDPFEAVRQMSLPRFAQSWSRGRYGDASALLFEVGALIYLIPPIAGLIYTRPNEYKIFQKLIVTIVLVFTFYFGFASGTRSVLGTYVITFGGVYFLARHQITLRQVLTLVAPTLVILFFANIYMVEFRNRGLNEFSFAEQHSVPFFVDYNIVNVSRLTGVFPDSFEFLGFEIPFNALIRPIPRVLWPGKPDGLSVSIETALAAGPGVTYSCTFVGEAYMSGGLLAVLFFSLLLGVAAELWNRVGNNSNLLFAQLLYVSGFLCAAIAMRSMLSMMPFILPSLALWLCGKLWLSRSSLRRRSRVICTNKL